MIGKKQGLVLVGIFLMAFLTMLIIANTETLILTVSDVNTTSGSQDVNVPVFLENNVTVYGLEIGISHDSDLIFKNISLSDRMNNSIIDFNEADGEILIVAVLEEGISPGSGEILNLTFDISLLALGNYALNSTIISGANIDTTFYDMQFNPGTIHVDLI